MRRISSIPHIFDVYRKGNVALLNAVGNGIADDKGIYYFVPGMIKCYLDEDPVLQNAPTYLPFYQEDMDYVLEYFDDPVLKDVAEAGSHVSPEIRILLLSIHRREEDFKATYVFGQDDPNSIYSNLMRAYDNAIELRDMTWERPHSCSPVFYALMTEKCWRRSCLRSKVPSFLPVISR